MLPMDDKETAMHLPVPAKASHIPAHTLPLQRLGLDYRQEKKLTLMLNKVGIPMFIAC